MSFAGAFGAIAAQYGTIVELYRQGARLGEGRAILRPLYENGRQVTPTRLGLRQADKVLCFGEGGLPFVPTPGELLLRQGEEWYVVETVRPVEVGEDLVCWRAVLTRREEGPA